MEEENVNMNEETQSQAAEPVVRKEGFLGKLGQKIKETSTKIAKGVKRNKGKIAGGLAIIAAMAYGICKIVANGKPGVAYDPDFGPEPGDWEPEDLYASEETVEENSAEEVSEE